MRKAFAKFILRIIGWKITGFYPPEIRKCIVIQAPHTSNWDFILGRLGFFYYGVRVKFLIKKEMFFFPLGPIVKWLGGIPVDRSKTNNMVDYIAELFAKHETMVIVITPEGTRKYNAHWKKGFYFIAYKANLPILLAYLDYAKKAGGIGPTFWPTGDYKKDLVEIESYYQGMTAKFPENFNLTVKK